MSNTPQVLVRRSTNVLTLKKLKDVIANTYPNDATVTCTLNDASGTPVTGATDLAVTYVAGTSGAATLYRALIPSTVDLSGDDYTAVISVTSGGAKREINVPCTAVDG